MRVAKILELSRLGASQRVYRIWSGPGSLDFEGVSWSGTSSDTLALRSVAPVEFSLNETAKNIKVEIVTKYSTFISDVGYGSALSEGSLGLIYRDGVVWRRCPISFRGLITSVRLDVPLLRFDLSTRDIDRDRIRPVIWSHQSQLRRQPNDQAFRFLPILVKGVERNFLKAIEDR